MAPKTAFKKGHDPRRNMKGRPLKGVSIAECLRDAIDSKDLGVKVASALKGGTITLGKRKLSLNTREWLDLVRWAVTHVDGMTVKLPGDGRGSHIVVTFGVDGGGEE